MNAFSAEILVGGIMLLVGIVAGVEMDRAAQRTILEWRNTGRAVDTAQKRRQGLLIFLVSFLLGLFVLPHLSFNYSLLIWLPFAGGMALALLFLAVHRRLSPR